MGGLWHLQSPPQLVLNLSVCILDYGVPGFAVVRSQDCVNHSLFIVQTIIIRLVLGVVALAMDGIDKEI